MLDVFTVEFVFARYITVPHIDCVWLLENVVGIVLEISPNHVRDAR